MVETMLAKVPGHEAVPIQVQYTIFRRLPGPHFQPRRASQCERAAEEVAVVVVAVAVVPMALSVDGGQVHLAPKGERRNGGSAVRMTRKFSQS